MDSILELDSRSNLKERSLKTPGFNRDSEIHLRCRVGPLDVGLSGSGNRIGVGGTFRLRLAHLLKRLRTLTQYIAIHEQSV
jgi:hypothetical protein